MSAAAAAVNRGARWTPEQDEWLAEWGPRKGAKYCAEAMGRTYYSIILRLCKYASEALRGGDALPEADDLRTRFGISLQEFERFQQKEEKSAKSATQKPQQSRPLRPAITLSLSPAQQQAIDAVASGASIFLTGQAGTGKSATIHSLKCWAADHRKELAITATTGAAAVLIGGQTIHSFLGIGLAEDTAERLAQRTMNGARKNQKTLTRLQTLDILVIDEVSMMSAELIDKISNYLICVRGGSGVNAGSPAFGGVQMVFAGDFYQLPPVSGKFAFKSAEWARLNPVIVELSEIFRQSGENAGTFKEILGRARVATLTEEDISYLREHSAVKFPEGIEPTRLYAHTAMVNVVNDREYARLLSKGGGEAHYMTTYSSSAVRKWAEKAGIPEKVALCPGAQIMITWNIGTESGLVNGTRGVVKECREKTVVIQGVSGRQYEIGYYRASPGGENEASDYAMVMPLKLAWATTIHKSQGASIDACEVSIGDKIFEYGQAYVALSRAKHLSSLKIAELSRGAFRANPEVVAYYASCR